MTTDKPEEAMTFGELLALIGDQQRRLTVLENAFSSLIFCLDDRASQLLVHNLSLEAKTMMNSFSNILPVWQNHCRNASAASCQTARRSEPAACPLNRKKNACLPGILFFDSCLLKANIL